MFLDFRDLTFTVEPKAGLELKILLIQPFQCWDACPKRFKYLGIWYRIS